MQTYEDSIIIEATPEDLFAYYTDLGNLARMVPPAFKMRVVKAQLPLREGSLIRFGLRPRAIPFEVTWDARVIEFEAPNVFADKQVRGPFEYWQHRHEFTPLEDGRTLVRDTIQAGAVRGMLGMMLEHTVLKQMIQKTFDYRRNVLRARFR